MRTVGVKNLKNRLSEYLRLVAAGETVLVTHRDRVVAELTPPRVGRAERLEDAALAEAVRKGWIRPPLLPGPGAPERDPVLSLADLLEGMEQDREDR
ncbi:MAG: prevent-host-death protein [Gemmatimonadales bacterium]|jgi:antitoxin (DNA-binding transcriptional repressor) of toxin-antitoxin stability system|nr:MAG: prevent-host-death protein [Gemmatimonadales bacterium]